MKIELTELVSVLGYGGSGLFTLHGHVCALVYALECKKRFQNCLMKFSRKYLQVNY